MNRVKRLVFKFLKKFFPGFIRSNMLADYIKASGCEIGENTLFYDAGTVTVDLSRPALLKIGDYCKITAGVIILTHDYSRSVLRRVYGEVIGEARRTEIGDNVFIGMRSIILMGTKIGKNCIVGAGSICSGEYPDNSVIAGNPAKVICSLDEYYKKRKSRYIGEAMDYARLFNEKYKKKPTVSDMGAFFPLYLERSIEALQKNNIRTKLGGDSEKEVVESFLGSTPQFESCEYIL